MKYWFLILFLVILVPMARAQNLVPNPSFEVLDSCPNLYCLSGSLQYCSTWFTPFSLPFPNGGGSAEVFSPCATLATLRTPSNAAGYQIPHSGTNYGGIFLIKFTFREYIENELTETLQAGENYCVSFYYSYANDYQTFTDGLGVLFTNDSLLYVDSNGIVIHLPPTVEQDSGYIVQDTTNWILFQKEFIAQGGEKFFTIGNFKYNYENLIVQLIGDTSLPASYIYIDDISVVQCDSLTAVTNDLVTNKNDFNIYPNPSNDLVEIRSDKKSESIIITDASGRIIYQTEPSQNNFKISTKSFANGVYIVQLKQLNGVVANKKMIVQH